MKVWLDDVRPAPGQWIWVKTANDAIHCLATEKVSALSLDHDLGGRLTRGSLAPKDKDGNTGMTVIEWLENNGHWPLRIIIHSRNLIGQQMYKRCKVHTAAIWAPFNNTVEK